jgi:myo-inositol-1(or 4)-monophosphatase
MRVKLVDTGFEERIRAGREAVLSQVEFFHEHLGRVRSEWKNDSTRVTAADLSVAKEIFRALADRFPEDDLFSEEMDPGQGLLVRQGEFSWVLDPIDGTNNYALGVPQCSISLALLRDGWPVYGIIYDGGRRRLMEGGPGHGLRDGDERQTGERPAAARSDFVGIHSPRKVEERPLLHPILDHFKVRAMGSSTLHLAYVANGLLAGMVDFNVRVWDIAAAVALCHAVGMEVRFLRGNPFPLNDFDLGRPPMHMCAGSSQICDRIEGLLRDKASA